MDNDIDFYVREVEHAIGVHLNGVQVMSDDCFRFNFRGTRFRVALVRQKEPLVEEVGDGILISSESAKLLERCIVLYREVQLLSSQIDQDN